MARKHIFDVEPVAHEGAPSVAVTASARPRAETTRASRSLGALGAISRSLEDISERSRRAEEVEARFAGAEATVEIDPSFIDASFARDRMAAFEPEGADAGFVAAIKEQGQLVPVLLRKRPDAEGRFQPAYGRRRIAAAAFLGRRVRAIVRELSDEQLVVAQGQENEARNALTFIEKCRFAATLEAQGFSRKIIESALSVHKSDLSNMLQVIEAVPAEIVDWIGPAPEVGRPRWVALAAQLRDLKAKTRAKQAISREKLAAANSMSSERFSRLVAALSAKPAAQRRTPWALPGQTKAYGSLLVSPNKIVLTIDSKTNAVLASLAVAKIEELRRALEAEAFPSTPNEE
jgi:ParB family chromosome partitioning protein